MTKWNGNTESGSPYYNLRQEGHSHSDAVAIIEDRKKPVFWVDQEIKARKGHIKYITGDNGRLVVEMRKPGKLFIVRSWNWVKPAMKMNIVEVKHLKTRNQAEKEFKRIYNEF